MHNLSYKIIFDLIQAGDFQSALDKLADEIANSPNDPYLLYCAGLAHRRLNNLDTAAEYYRRSINIDSRNPSVHLGLGIVYQLQGRYEQAIKSLQIAINLEPHFAEAHNSLGLTYSKLGDYRLALQCYERVAEGIIDLAHSQLKKAPEKYATPRVSAVGESVLMTNEDAFSEIEQFLKSNLMWAINSNNMARCFAAIGEKSRARDMFQESIAFIPAGVNYDAPFVGLKDLSND